MSRRTITVEQYRELAAPPKRGHKYHARKTEYAGVIYASQAEAQYARGLDLAVELGLLRFWIPQPTFRLGCPENVYRPDFLTVASEDRVGALEVKGRETPKFLRDKKLWEHYGPCPLLIVYRDHEETIKGGQEK